MILVTVRSQYQVDQIENALSFLREIVLEASALEGYESQQICILDQNPATILIFQRWSNRTSFEAYRQSAFFARLSAKLKPLMTGAPQTIIYDATQVD